MVNREDAAVGGGTVVIGAAAVAVAASTTETGPILAFVAALMVALITAYTTNRRQQRSLDEERDRLATQLRHERHLADLADLRAVLEESLAAANRARQAVLEGWWDSAKKEAGGRAVGELEAQLDRLHVRLGKEEAIVKAYTTMGNVTHALNRLPPPPQQPTRDEVLSMPEILTWGQAYHHYVDLAQARVGSQDKAE
jgi:hypothetical protein